MKTLLKKLTVALSLTMMLTVVGCGTSGDSAATPAPSTDAEATATPEAEGTETPEGEDTATADGMKIVVVTSPSGVDDGSFNQDNYEGVLAYIEENPNVTVKTVQEEDMAASISAIESVVADYDVIVSPGFQFAGVGPIAEENPDKKFILVDSFPADADGNEMEVENIYAMQFAEQESGFFAGVAAAKETKTGKIAVVNGIAFPSNVNYQFGFESGVNYANANLGTSAELVEIKAYAGTDVTNANVGGNYIGDFNDPATGKVVGEALINEGCDIMFVAAGGSGLGVITAAKEATDVKIIGCDVDQFDDGVNGDSNVILTSGVKNMALNVNRQLQAIADGSFKGGNYVLKADSDSTGLVVKEGRQQLSAETIEAVNAVYEQVKAGEIVPASNFSGTTPEDFPGLK